MLQKAAMSAPLGFQFHKGAIRTAINANYAAKVTSISIP